MDFKAAMQKRHTVRKYLEKEIEAEKVSKICNRIEALNEKYNLSMKFITNDKNGISAGWKLIAKNAFNYVILAGNDDDKTKVNLGYCSADIMLFAQTLGLNSWWIGGMYSKKVKKFVDGKNIVGIVVIGYGAKQGSPHKSKSANAVSTYEGQAPDWFIEGVEAALLAPTAINRQGFTISGMDNEVSITYISAPFDKEDLGIVKYHFELGAGQDNFTWV